MFSTGGENTAGSYPVVARCYARWCELVQGRDSFAGGGLGESDAVSGGDDEALAQVLGDALDSKGARTVPGSGATEGDQFVD